jgi:hypothetical protein
MKWPGIVNRISPAAAPPLDESLNPWYIKPNLDSDDLRAGVNRPWNPVQIRGGPAAVTGDKAGDTTVWAHPDGKGRGRLIRKPEDEQINPQGRFMVTTAPGQSRQGLFFAKCKVQSGKWKVEGEECKGKDEATAPERLLLREGH